MAVFPNNSADYPGVPVSEEAPMLQYSLDEEHPPRDLTPEEKTFLNALAGFIMPLEQSLFFQIKDLQRHTKLVLSHSGGRFDSYESLKREELEKEFADLSKMMNDFQHKLWCGQLSEENEDLFAVWHELWELLRDKLEKMPDQPEKPKRLAPMGGYYNRGRDSKVEIFVDTIEESAHNDPYHTMLLMGQVLLHEYFHSFHFHVGTGGEEPLKCMEETMVEYGTLVLLDRVASSGLPVAKDAGAALKDLLARAQRNQNRSQHATAYALGAYLYENHKEEASNLIAQYANVSCLLDESCEEESECEESKNDNKLLTTMNNPFTIRGKSLVSCAWDAAGHIRIPDGVKRIEISAFKECHHITSVEIPDSVTKIGNWAFYGCSRLKSVKLPQNGSLTMGMCVFTDCSKLEEVDLPEGMKVVPYSIFNACRSLRRVGIPDSVTEIEDWAFYECEHLKNIRLPQNLKKIGMLAFYNCKSILQLELTEGLTEVDCSAFEGCTGLTELTIPQSLTNIHDAAFAHCTKLKNLVVAADHPAYCFENGMLLTKDHRVLKAWLRPQTKRIEVPNGVVRIGGGTFRERTMLTEVHLPDGVKEIGYDAFWGCTRLDTINFPKSVTKIENGAFSACRSLITIELPQSLTRIGGAAFIGCKMLLSIRIPNRVTKIEDWSLSECENLLLIYFERKGLKSVRWGENILDGVDKSQCVIIVPKGTVEEYKAHPAFKGFNIEEE